VTGRFRGDLLCRSDEHPDGARDGIALRGKGVKRREVGMDRWAWEQIGPWAPRSAGRFQSAQYLCVISGRTAGRRREASAARKQLHHAAAAANGRRRFAPGSDVQQPVAQPLGFGFGKLADFRVRRERCRRCLGRERVPQTC
jgi:hypothetical protein